jgi:hypothetical protein
MQVITTLHINTKMKSAAILSLFTASATAFAPAPVSTSSTSLAGSVFDDYVGAKDFRGAEFKFDPLKLSETYEPFQGWFRETELRHGRTAMLAVTGFVVTDYVRIPGDMYSFASIPSTIDAHDALLKTGPMYQLLLWIGLFDIIVTAPSVQAMGEGEREPGGESISILICIAFYRLPNLFLFAHTCMHALGLIFVTSTFEI